MFLGFPLDWTPTHCQPELGCQFFSLLTATAASTLHQSGNDQLFFLAGNLFVLQHVPFDRSEVAKEFSEVLHLASRLTFFGNLDLAKDNVTDSVTILSTPRDFHQQISQSGLIAVLQDLFIGLIISLMEPLWAKEAFAMILLCSPPERKACGTLLAEAMRAFIAAAMQLVSILN